MGHNDFKKKEPSKTEKVLYELYMQQYMLERNLMTTSAHVVALGILMDIAPEKIAEMLTDGNEKIKDYSDKINKALDEIQQKKQAAGKTDESLPSIESTEAPTTEPQA